MEPRGAAPALGVVALLACVGGSAGCRAPEDWRRQADAAAYPLIELAQREALGRSEPFSISPAERTLRERLLLDQRLPVSDPASADSALVEPIEQWPDAAYLSRGDDPSALAPLPTPLPLTLIEALQVAATNSREYRSRKEQVFSAALRLDLEADAFRNTWAGVVDSLLSTDQGADPAITGVEQNSSLGVSRRFEGGARFTGLLAADLVKLISGGSRSSLGLRADASLSIPLLRGSGRFVVTEPLTQAQREVVYQVLAFEQFKQDLAVDVASTYLSVLRSEDQVANAAENYTSVVASSRRARRLADAGRLPEIQVDQARQDELRARNNWISAQQAHEQRLDEFKTLLGLPPDALLTLDRSELSRLNEDPRYTFARASDSWDPQGAVPSADDDVQLVPPTDADAGPLEIPEARAIEIALLNRPDLRTAVGRIVDAQRGAAIAADNLRADVTLLGAASLGSRRTLSSATLDNASLDPSEGFYSLLLGIDLPLERTLERNDYRNTLIDFEAAVRDLQATEDRVKAQVRQDLRTLLEARETLKIQGEAVEVARRRVESTDLFLQAGRAEIRDVLEAQDSLLSAQNALTAALVSYRVAELELQRDMGVLLVDETGLWTEYDPRTDQQPEGTAPGGQENGVG